MTQSKPQKSNCVRSAHTPTTPKLLFEKLILSPDTSSKLHRMALIALTFSLEAFPKKIVSFSYCKTLIYTSFLPTVKPSNSFFSYTSLIKPFCLSANSHQPCTLGVPSSANKKTSVVEMRMLRCINGHTRRDKIRNMCIQGIE